ncbi:helix-turn-helix domain-containing protein [Herbaspirillum sp. GCM10030257]|uniref:helix-turn-helix domain-containing protein n=1 Tax=Herbaspirillum sp. GCM10030257 TaxID=3273393 RepID=UPI003614100B
MFFMESLQKAIDICGSQANLAKRITESLKPSAKPVTPQHIWNWLNRDKSVPAEYCPTIEKVCERQVLCEELNDDPDWEYVRDSAATVKTLRGRRTTAPKG